MLWYFHVSSSQTKLSDGALSSPTGGCCCHPARVCGIASICDQRETDTGLWSLLQFQMLFYPWALHVWVRERNKEKKHSSFPPSSDRLSTAAAAAYEARPAAVCAVCVSLPAQALSVCPSQTTHTHTHTADDSLPAFWELHCMSVLSAHICSSEGSSGALRSAPRILFVFCREDCSFLEGSRLWWSILVISVAPGCWDERLLN